MIFFKYLYFFNYKQKTNFIVTTLNLRKLRSTILILNYLNIVHVKYFKYTLYIIIFYNLKKRFYIYHNMLKNC